MYVAVWCSVLVAFGAFGCDVSSNNRQRTQPPNVVLLSIDTLRADRLGIHGYRLETSPQMDELARRGVRFDDATVPWTRTWPSMAAMLTGTYPTTNGVRFRPRRPLPEENETLAETLAEAGYATAAVVANVNLGRLFAFDQGFDHFVEAWAKEAERQTGSPDSSIEPGWVKKYTNATIVTDEAIALLEEVSLREPFFLWLHYMDPHGPYLPPAGYAGLFADDHPPNEVPIYKVPRYQWQFEDGAPIADLGHYEAQYDREIRYLDDEIGRFLAELERHGASDRTLVVLTADHGESLTENGEFLRHGSSPYQPEARVPLVLVLPGKLPPDRVIDHPVGLIDLTPTILDLVGLPRSSEAQGRSLVPTIQGSSPPSELIFLESGWDEATQLAVRKGRWKLVRLRAPRDRRRFGRAAAELYDLASDPGEQRNVIDQNPELAESLGAALDDWLITTPRFAGTDPADAPIDAKTRKMLRALGYADAH